uniref:Uncharacterized protein n=1 Tax=Arundo donax TaxID=35708 RepID=A0A0A9CNU6_ARUDO
MPSSVNIPHSLAIALAVLTLSPVTILTMIPADIQALTASLTPGRTGSLMPKMDIRVKPHVGLSASSSKSSTSLYARHNVLKASEAKELIVSKMFFL